MLELVVSIFREVTDLKRGELSQRLLAQAGMALATPLDFETRLSNMAQLVVPDLADWCAVDMLQTDGTARRLTVVHIDPSKVALAHELYQRYPPRPDESTGLYAVPRSGQSQFYPDLSDSFLETTITDREQLAIARQLQLRSVMIVPLAARDRTLGAITFVSAESGRRWSQTSEPLCRRGVPSHAPLLRTMSGSSSMCR